MVKSIFLTGVTGYIGGTVFAELVQNHKDEYEVTALVRSSANAQKVQAAGGTVVVGSYDKPELLIDAAKTFDIIIHTGESADHYGSAEAILEGLSQRPASAAPAIYIHTSGTAVLSDSAHGDVEAKKVFDDLKPEEIDNLDSSQPHKNVELLVREKAKELKDRAKTVIITPPNIYGVGAGPANVISIQTPMLIRFAIKNKFAPQIGPGINWWNNVHIKDLARGFVILLKDMEKAGTPGWNGYVFAETEEHQWKDIYSTLGKVLYAKGLVESPTPESPAARLGTDSDYAAITAESGQAFDAWGMNSRGRANRLRKLGWKKVEKDDVLASIEHEVDHIYKHEFK